MNSAVSFGDLPVELIVQIFSLLDEKSFFEISDVCKRWKEIKDSFFFTDEVILLDKPARRSHLDDCFRFYVSGVIRLITQIPFKGSHVTFGSATNDEGTWDRKLYRGTWMTPVQSRSDSANLMRHVREPYALEILTPLETDQLTKILRHVDPLAPRIMRLNIESSTPGGVEFLQRFTELRSLTIFDTRPSLAKLLALIGHPLVSLSLFEKCESDVLTSNHLLKYFSSTTFDQLTSLHLRKSRINDACAAVLRKKCPNLWNLEVQKLSDLSPADELTRKGFEDFLHLPMLKFLEVVFPFERDWLYRRKRWVPHSCDPTGDCPVGIDRLLEEWDDTSSIVVDF